MRAGSGKLDSWNSGYRASCGLGGCEQGRDQDETARRNHMPAFEGKVAPVALRSETTFAELAQQFDVHAHPIA